VIGTLRCGGDGALDLLPAMLRIKRSATVLHRNRIKSIWGACHAGVKNRKGYLRIDGRSTRINGRLPLLRRY